MRLKTTFSHIGRKWTAKEFLRLGYKVRGLGFIVRIKSWYSFKLFTLLHYLPWLSRAFLRFSAFLVAVKDVNAIKESK